MSANPGSSLARYIACRYIACPVHRLSVKASPMIDTIAGNSEPRRHRIGARHFDLALQR
jgi:hypothetical protein